MTRLWCIASDSWEWLVPTRGKLWSFWSQTLTVSSMLSWPEGVNCSAPPGPFATASSTKRCKVEQNEMRWSFVGRCASTVFWVFWACSDHCHWVRFVGAECNCSCIWGLYSLRMKRQTWVPKTRQFHAIPRWDGLKFQSRIYSTSLVRYQL